MRGLLAGLTIAIVVIVVVLLGAVMAAFGVAAIGWLLHRAFDLTQWQGSLIALAAASGLGYLVFRLVVQPTVPSVWNGDWEPWDEEPEGDREADAAESPIVAWRRSRPTPGELPTQKPTAARSKRK